MSVEKYKNWKKRFTWHVFWQESLTEDYNDILERCDEGICIDELESNFTDCGKRELPMYYKSLLLEQKAHFNEMERKNEQFSYQFDQWIEWIHSEYNLTAYPWGMMNTMDVEREMVLLYPTIRSDYYNVNGKYPPSPWGYKNPMKYPFRRMCKFMSCDNTKKLHPTCTHKNVGFTKIEELYKSRHYNWMNYTSIWDEVIEKYYIIRKVFNMDLANLIYVKHINDLSNKSLRKYIQSQLYDETALMFLLNEIKN